MVRLLQTGGNMKKVLTIMSIGLLVGFMAAPVSMGMGRAKKCCGDDASGCCGKEAAACTKCPEGECKCAPAAEACTKCPEGECKCEK